MDGRRLDQYAEGVAISGNVGIPLPRSVSHPHFKREPHRLTSLHALTWRNCPSLGPKFIPYLRPHTLRTTVLDGVERVESGFFQVLIGEHAESLQRLHIERCGDLLNAYIPARKAQRLQYLSVQTRMSRVPVAINGKLRASLIEISLDYPGFCCTQAMTFLRKRSGGPLKRFSVFFALIEGSGWEEVRNKALGFGITFSITKTHFQVGGPDGNHP
jgi:hypothetical protein